MLFPPLPGVDHTILETAGLRHTRKSIHSKERKVGTVLLPCLDCSGNIEKLPWQCAGERPAREEGVACDDGKCQDSLWRQ